MAAQRQEQRPRTLTEQIPTEQEEAEQSEAGHHTRQRAEPQHTAHNRLPTRAASLVFWAKATLLKARRGAQDAKGGLKRLACRPMLSEEEAGWKIAGEARTALYAEQDASERGLQLGKVQNLRRALRQLNGGVLPAGATFSFWKQVGRATKRRGYVAGRQLREGCLFPAIGGGLCQLSNALYAVAMQANCEIVERHPHTRIIPGSMAEQGQDATVAWNYIDLRFRAAIPLYLQAVLTRDTLIVRLYAMSSQHGSYEPLSIDTPAIDAPVIDALPTAISVRPFPGMIRLAELTDGRPVLNARDHSCVSCGASACFRHDAPDVRALRLQAATGASIDRVAFLVDEHMPEFTAYVQAQQEKMQNEVQRGTQDRTAILFVPLDGIRLKQARYAWPHESFARVETALLPTLHRAIMARRMTASGAAILRQAQIEGAARLAAHYGRRVPWDVSRMVVAQSLLPFLWQNGRLGGRTFDALMSGLPLDTLHARLDAAFAAYPERVLLHDFRADPVLVRAERNALNAARRIITPHADIAALFPGQAVKLDWQMPSLRSDASLRASRSAAPAARPRTIAFPGPTHARKGAYELRDMARALDLHVVLIGGELEGEGFWQGVTTRRIVPNKSGSTDWLAGVSTVVQPAVVEDKPRRLLEALSRGVPVIATPACGLGDLPGVTTVPAGDEAALRQAITHCLDFS